MRKTGKRKSVFAWLMVCVLALGMSLNTWAAEEPTSSIVVTGDKEFAGKTVNAVQIFSAKTDGSGAVAYTLSKDLETFFTSEATDKYGCKGKSGQELSDAANKYIHDLGSDDSTAVTEFAAEILAWVKANNIKVTQSATAVLSGDASSQTYAATLSGLTYGYYLVYPEGGATSAARHTNAQLISLTSAAQVDIHLKSEYPTVEKTIVDGKTEIASDGKIGDKITFQLTSKVPDLTAYTAYTFKFVDTLSKGLTFGEVTSVKVGTTELTVTQNYLVEAKANATDSEMTDLTVELLDFFNQYKAAAGTEIVVTYTAVLNEKAVVGDAGNANSAHVEYSTNPDGSGSGTSVPAVVKAYTFDFTIDKYTGDNYDATAKHLAGAVFEVKKSANAADASLSFIAVDPGSANTAAIYRIAKDGETGASAVTTPESGLVQITGLAADTYYLHEITAPAGYNKLASPLKITITANYDLTTKEFNGVAVAYGDGDTLAETGHIIPVKNSTGFVLPSTGGTGTLILTVCGVALVIFGAVRHGRKTKASR